MWCPTRSQPHHAVSRFLRRRSRSVLSARIVSGFIVMMVALVMLMGAVLAILWENDKVRPLAHSIVSTWVEQQMRWLQSPESTSEQWVLDKHKAKAFSQNSGVWIVAIQNDELWSSQVLDEASQQWIYDMREEVFVDQWEEGKRHEHRSLATQPHFPRNTAVAERLLSAQDRLRAHCQSHRPLPAKERIFMTHEHGFVVVSAYPPGAEVHFVADFHNEYKPWVVLFSLVIVVGFVWLAYRWVAKLIAPVHDITKGAKDFSIGHWGTRIQAQCDDELGELAHTFNRMADSLEQQFKQQQNLLIAMSHELKTPLARLKVIHQMPQSDANQQRAMRAMDQMQDLIDQLLQALQNQMTVHQSDLQSQAVDLADLTHKLVQSEHSVSDQQIIRLDCVPETLWVTGNEFQWQLMIRNLLSNALKYGQGHPIHIRCWQDADSKRIHWQIEDQGVGLSPTDLTQIFEPFYRVDASRSRESGGAGLGLYLVKSIADSLNVHIKVTSTIGEGTRFVLSQSMVTTS